MQHDEEPDIDVWQISLSVTQDGRSSSLTAPHGPSQQDVVRSALADALAAAAELAGVQMHGTGTPLGDPIEIGALCGVIKARYSNLSLSPGAPLFIRDLKRAPYLNMSASLFQRVRKQGMYDWNYPVGVGFWAREHSIANDL